MDSSMRKKLADAMHRERMAKVAYHAARTDREKIATEYYSMKYNIAGGGSVYLADVGQEIRLSAFIQWSDNIDDRPGVVGRLVHPFGIDNKAKTFKSHEWVTKAELDGEEDAEG